MSREKTNAPSLDFIFFDRVMVLPWHVAGHGAVLAWLLCTRETTFVTSCLLYCKLGPCWKESSLQGNVEKPFFQKGCKNILTELLFVLFSCVMSFLFYRYHCSTFIYCSISVLFLPVCDLYAKKIRPLHIARTQCGNPRFPNNKVSRTLRYTNRYDCVK